ncbi:MAG: hypothetical protein A3F43_06710 [Gammaproteobacteria bacterium RIFCSPHIGHO2_12_FULL_42_10]|nr:MAG: hypothetical protein A3F43_06710 [Gammaproteobacteria bacterium RIFCSPHIGHO2_12_FULL_42_10]
MSQLHPNEAHVWSIQFSHFKNHSENLYALLSTDERLRADKLCIALSKERYIISRGVLRLLLAQYSDQSPQVIQFSYTEHKKPYLTQDDTRTPIQFNLAHSDDIAIFSISTLAVGVDIEKIIKRDPLAIAKRYFSTQECATLAALTAQERHVAFYRIWSRKEAILKAMGVGLLTIPLEQVIVSANDMIETITLNNQRWSLRSLDIHADYASALASHPSVDKIVRRVFSL